MGEELSTQRGAATLFITLILLLLSSLILLYTFRDGVTEQHLSANEIRGKQAFAAANAGIEHALAYLGNGGADHDRDGVADTITSDTLFSTGQKASYYKVVYCSPAAVPPTCPTSHASALSCTAPAPPFTSSLILSCGWSDDESSVIRITTIGHRTSALAGTLTAPFVTRGTANLLVGGASIFNYFNDLTVWSGGGIPSLSNTGKTFLRDTVNYPAVNAALDSDNDGIPDYRDTGNSPGCSTPPTGYVCSTRGTTIGMDTVMNDTRLSSLTSDEFFQVFMGHPPSVWRDTVASWIVDPGGALADANSSDINSISNMVGESIWVEGNASLSGAIGTQTNPVVLVINGDAYINSNVVVNGLVFVTGNVSGTGTPTIYGALIAGSGATSGNLKIIFDPSVLAGAAGTGKAASLQGSWKDW